MKILHISSESNGYEEVELLANRVSRTNALAVIRKGQKVCLSGGFLLEDTPEIRKVLDLIPKPEQIKFVKMFKETPFAKPYYDEL